MDLCVDHTGGSDASLRRLGLPEAPCCWHKSRYRAGFRGNDGRRAAPPWLPSSPVCAICIPRIRQLPNKAARLRSSESPSKKGSPELRLSSAFIFPVRVRRRFLLITCGGLRAASPFRDSRRSRPGSRCVTARSLTRGRVCAFLNMCTPLCEGAHEQALTRSSTCSSLAAINNQKTKLPSSHLEMKAGKVELE